MKFLQGRSAPVTVIMGILAGLAVMAPPARSQDNRQATESCMECHSSKGESIKFKDGTQKSVYVDPQTWNHSIHGGQLTCTDCHREITGYPHPKKVYKDSKDFRIAMANTCQRCHYAYYTRVLDGMHYKLLQAGDTSAPTCVDCHGSHGIKDPKNPRTEVNAKCAQCHSDVQEVFAKSVHGKALMQEGNTDVPVCTDCHGAHAIEDPTKAHFKLNSHQLCSKCHSNEKMMKKYGLSAQVATTYLEDFHGMSNKLYADAKMEPGKKMASCADCHGNHDIQSFKAMRASASKEQVRERVAQVCQRCHQGAPVAFADAWMSHYPPTLEKAPVVWGVKMAYKVLIPLIMAGLVLHILLHLWRLRRRRG